MMPKKKKNAQPATEDINPSDSEDSEPTDKIREDLQPDPDIIAQKIEAPKLNPEQRLALIEAQLKQADANFKQIGDFLTKIEPLAQLSEQIQQAQQQQPTGAANPQPGLGGFNQILQAMQALGIGASSSNPLGEELTKKVIDAGLQQMFAGTELLKAMQTKMLADMGAKQIKQSFE